MPHFRFRVVKTFQDCLSRQVAESVRIDLREDFLNSKTVFIRSRLPRLEIEKSEWEKESEEKRNGWNGKKEKIRNRKIERKATKRKKIYHKKIMIL